MKRLIFSLCASAVGCAFALQFPATAVARSKETVLHSFGSGTDGKYTYAGLIDVNGTLYGTTYEGGVGDCGVRGFHPGCGTVFSVNPTTGAETVVYSFLGGTDGESPEAGLIEVNGTLYGTTNEGGAHNGGTVFSVNPASGAETVIYSFCGQNNCTDGLHPEAGLLNVNGTLYSTTHEGGAQDYGTVFSVNPTTGAETVVYSFLGGTDGWFPYANLIDVKGTLYGTTYYGGANGGGTAFSINPATGAETVLHTFGGATDGSEPEAGLVDVKGTLYGTTVEDGTAGEGTVFALDPKTGAETVLHAFGNGTDGQYPYAGLIDVKGTLYGTTGAGGASGDGTVYAVNPTTGAETVLYSFCGQQNCTDGAQPYPSLIDVKGKLYGTTQDGGAYGGGTVFALKKP